MLNKTAAGQSKRDKETHALLREQMMLLLSAFYPKYKWEWPQTNIMC